MGRGSSSNSSVGQCCRTLNFQIFMRETNNMVWWQIQKISNHNIIGRHRPWLRYPQTTAPQNLLTLGVKYSLMNLLTKSVWVCTFSRCTWWGKYSITSISERCLTSLDHLLKCLPGSYPGGIHWQGFHSWDQLWSCSWGCPSWTQGWQASARLGAPRTHKAAASQAHCGARTLPGKVRGLSKCVPVQARCTVIHFSHFNSSTVELQLRVRGGITEPHVSVTRWAAISIWSLTALAKFLVFLWDQKYLWNVVNMIHWAGGKITICK